jgi:signal transduction histidine kinase
MTEVANGRAPGARDEVPALRTRPALFPTARTVLQALVVGRWLAWAWMVGILVFTTSDRLRHPWLGWLAVALTLALTVASTVMLRSTPERLRHAPFVAAEVALAVGLSIVDGFVFEPGHVFATTQSIATQWPLIAAATAGVSFGPVIAAALGALIGPGEWLGALANDHGPFTTNQVVSLVATSLFYGALGAVFGWHARLLQRVEGEIADRRARDEVARVMHDTVLQTLALVERRSAERDPELAAAARDADAELRAYLFGSAAPERTGLEARVRAVIERVRRGHDIPVTVSVVDGGCRLDDDEQDLLARAIGEAVANAIEHAGADRVVVFVETDDAGHVFASVLDDGVGFDTSAPRASHGIDQSIIGRVASIGGRVTIESGSGGTEVCLWSHA